MNQVLLKITGRVQGVFYRSNAQSKAQALSLAGYAKNMPDRSVEVLIQGEKSAINSFINWCRQGPPSADVDNIEIIWQEPGESMNNFRIA